MNVLAMLYFDYLHLELNLLSGKLLTLPSKQEREIIFGCPAVIPELIVNRFIYINKT